MKTIHYTPTDVEILGRAEYLMGKSVLIADTLKMFKEVLKLSDTDTIVLEYNKTIVEPFEIEESKFWYEVKDARIFKKLSDKLGF